MVVRMVTENVVMYMHSWAFCQTTFDSLGVQVAASSEPSAPEIIEEGWELLHLKGAGFVGFLRLGWML